MFTERKVKVVDISLVCTGIGGEPLSCVFSYILHHTLSGSDITVIADSDAGKFLLACYNNTKRIKTSYMDSGGEKALGPVCCGNIEE